MTITGSSAFSSSIKKIQQQPQSQPQQPQQEVSIKDRSTLGPVVTEVTVHAGKFKASNGVDCLHSDEIEKVIKKLNFLLSPDFILIPGKLDVDGKQFSIDDQKSFCEAVCHLINQYLVKPGFDVYLRMPNLHLSVKILSGKNITDLLLNFFDRGYS